MSNILTYLTWRGDITFEERPFNEVDNLVLAEFSYVNFFGVVPSLGDTSSITVADAYETIKGLTLEMLAKALSDSAHYLELFEKLAHSKRYSNAVLSNYVDIYDMDRQVQMAALHIALDDDTTYIAFRGTDQTITGWREDFAMSFMIVDAQKEAVRYLEQTMAPGIRYRLGGHSKGGSLAVYSAMECGTERQKQITEIYSNDGPGFSPELIQTSHYEAIRSRIIRIVPEFGVIGHLFEQDPPHMIVKSNAEGLTQHSGTTWRVEGGQFVTSDDLLPRCKEMNKVFDAWIEDVTMEERLVFVKEFFDALEAGGAQNIDEVAKNGIGGFESILTALVGTKKDTKSVIGKLIKSFARRLKPDHLLNWLKTKSIHRGILVFLLGILFTKLPGAGMQIVTTIAVFAIVFVAARRILYHIRSKRQWSNVGTYSIIFYSLVIAVLSLLAMQQTVFLWSANFALGIICCVYGYYNLKKWLEIKDKRSVLYWFTIIRSVIVVLITTGQDMWAYTLVVGSFMILEGVIEVVSGTVVKIRSNV